MECGGREEAGPEGGARGGALPYELSRWDGKRGIRESTCRMTGSVEECGGFERSRMGYP